MYRPQWIDLDGAVNVRDLGNLPAADGRSTRPGVLLRSDAVHQLSERDVAVLTGEIGVRHIVDLRSPGERVEQTRGLLGTTTVRYSELDVLSDALIASRRIAREEAVVRGDDPATIIAEGYHQMLELGAPAFVTALHRLTAEDGVPALVHCSAGKDRTGVLVALLLDVAGVGRDVIVADYNATHGRMEAVRARLAAMTAYVELAATATEQVLGAHAATMEQFLDRLYAEAGTAEAWFLAAGASQAALDTWRERFLA